VVRVIDGGLLTLPIDGRAGLLLTVLLLVLGLRLGLGVGRLAELLLGVLRLLIMRVVMADPPTRSVRWSLEAEDDLVADLLVRRDCANSTD
jgi:hypothetical protein